MTLTPAAVAEAAARLAGVAVRTPVLRSAEVDDLCGAEVFVKAENLQRTGSFKFRGAYNAVASLDPSPDGPGVVTYSSGNHARAIAEAARLVGVSAVIVMPHDAPTSKVEATRSAGARIVGYDRYAEDRVAIAARLAETENRVLVPPFDDHAVMAGQGTVARELVEQVPDLDELWVPVGGGGLLAGCGTALRECCPGARLVGVEPEAGDDHARSARAGRRIEIPVPRTIADGQQITAPGELTWPINRAHTDSWVAVSDQQIVAAMRVLLEVVHLVVEPSGASALAGVLAAGDEVRGRRVGVVLSGGNIDVDRLCRLMST